MSHPGTVREALIAEAIGDLATLLDRIQALQAAMGESTRSLLSACDALADRSAACDAQVALLVEKAKVQAVKHIVARTDEAARRSVAAPTRAMSEAAQTLFAAELEPTLQRFAASLRQWAERRPQPRQRWTAHVVTAASASAVTWMAVAWLGAH